tara:strand:- start:186 stop:515 length:330 start_codon:yes stop_codon:yes gene_type:complete
MACEILINNLTGHVISVFDSGQLFGKMESKARFVELGGADLDWSGKFFTYSVTDREPSELAYCKEQFGEEGLPRFSITGDQAIRQDFSGDCELTVSGDYFESILTDLAE